MLYYRAGCDDALVAVVDGKLFLDFDREAASYEAAVNSAEHNVRDSGGRVVTVKPIEE